MVRLIKIEHRETGWRLASRASRDARFPGAESPMWMGPAIIIKIRKRGLKPSYNQHSMKQSEYRLPVESRGWLAGEWILHTDKPSLIRLSTEDGGGMKGLRRFQASSNCLRLVQSLASTDLTSHSDGHATTASWKSHGDDRKLDSYRRQFAVACR
jgi:hypothetical protein